jgi:hypothetical protein
MDQCLFAEDAIIDNSYDKADKQQMETLPIRDGQLTQTNINSIHDPLLSFTRTSPGCCVHKTPIIIALYGSD